MTDALPAPRRPGTYSVAFVCSGNICRSPSADVVLRARLDAAGIAERVEVASSGIGDWHVGNPMDSRSADELRRRGYDPDRHRAQQVTPAWLEQYDVLLAMDRGHVEDLRRLGEGPVRLFRDFDPVGTGDDTPDPYYGGADGFTEVLTMVERTCDALVPAIERALGQDAPAS